MMKKLMKKVLHSCLRFMPFKASRYLPRVTRTLNRADFFNSKYTISARSLRRNPEIAAVQSLERAHIFSLEVSAELWKVIEGNQIHKRDLYSLKNALRSSRNIILTCRHTNKILHVQYDKEIIKCIKGNSLALSPGAYLRLNDIIRILNELRFEMPKRYVESSLSILTNIRKNCCVS